jgi:hypothetical protein
MNWQYNEHQGDNRWDDSKNAIIEALRAIAEQVERLNENIEQNECAKIWQVKDW